MDWSSFLVSMVLVLTTAAIYSAFPVLFAWLRKSEINRKTYRAWCVVITALIALVFSVFTSLGGGKISFSPAVLWGVIFYNTGIKILRGRNLLTENSGPKAEEITSTQTAELEHILSPKRNIVHIHKVPARASVSGQDGLKQSEVKNAERKKKPRLNILPILLSIGLAVACGVAMYQSIRVYELRGRLEQSAVEIKLNKDALKRWSDRYSKLQMDLNAAQHELWEARKS